LTDIVERLRKAYPPLAGYQRHVGEEAADEIERLRMQLADHGETITRLQEQLTVVRELRDCDDHDIEVSQMDAVGRLGVAIKRIAERDAKIERLRAALKELADAAEHDMKKNQEDEDGGWWSLRTENAIRGARRALLRTDNERLRAFIAELTADCPICHGLGCPPIGCGRALEPKP